jgi:phage baseplate assembly protein gpV
VTLPSINRVVLQALRASKIRGVQLAIVVDNKDGEGNPGYRVKLRFPWLSEQDSTFLARVAIPMGGPGRGTYMLPEIDDQVLVVFEHGDIDRPIVIGALWSKQQEPVEVNQSGKNNTKLIKSRSGHRIIFDDKEGAENIIIVDKSKKNKIVLDSANKTVKIESDGDVEVIAKANVIMHSNALKIGTSDTVTGKGASLLTHAAKAFGLKATSGITIGGGNTTINTSNAAACSVSGSGAGELGGAAAEQPKEQITVGAGAGNRRSSATAGQPLGSPVPGGTSAQAADVTKTFLDLTLIDTDGLPVSSAAYHVTASDGAVFSGKLGTDGHIRIEGIVEGRCTVTFHRDDTNAAR